VLFLSSFCFKVRRSAAVKNRSLLPLEPSAFCRAGRLVLFCFDAVVRVPLSSSSSSEADVCAYSERREEAREEAREALEGAREDGGGASSSSSSSTSSGTIKSSSSSIDLRP
jgi:hypothetical protein